MDYKFNYSLDKNDLINFELFKLKSSKFMSMIYITVLIMLVMNTYYAFSEKKLFVFAYSCALYCCNRNLSFLCKKDKTRYKGQALY